MMEAAELYRRYGPLVMRRCRRLLRDEAMALDATQDVFVNLLRAQSTLKEDRPANLLLRISTRVCLNRLRSARRRPEDPADELLSQIASVSDLESRTSVRRLLDRLFGEVPESTATLAVMHLVDGLTLEEVAEEVGMSVSGVRKRLRGLKAKLHALSQEEAV